MWIYHNCVSFAACVSWVIALPLRLVPAAVLLRMPSFIFLNSDLWIPRWFGSKKKREQRAGEALLSVNSLLKKERKNSKRNPTGSTVNLQIPLVIFFPVVEQAVLVYMHFLFLFRENKNLFFLGITCSREMCSLLLKRWLFFGSFCARCAEEKQTQSNCVQQRELQNLVFSLGWQMVLFFEIDDLW